MRIGVGDHLVDRPGRGTYTTNWSVVGAARAFSAFAAAAGPVGSRRTHGGAPRGVAPRPVRGMQIRMVLQVKGTTVSQRVSNARLGDPVATVSLPLVTATGSAPASYSGGGRGHGGGFDGSTTSAPCRSPRPPVKLLPSRCKPERHGLDTSRSDEFNGLPTPARHGPSQNGAAARRRSPAARCAGPPRPTTSPAAETRRGAAARPAPGASTAETKVSIDLGTDTVRNYQQAGLIAYVDDDRSPGCRTWPSGTPGRRSSARRCPTPAGSPTAAPSSGRPARRPGCG